MGRGRRARDAGRRRPRACRLSSSTAARMRFGATLARMQTFGHCPWVMYGHIGVARVQSYIPPMFRRPHGVFVHGIEAWHALPSADLEDPSRRDDQNRELWATRRNGCRKPTQPSVRLKSVRSPGCRSRPPTRASAKSRRSVRTSCSSSAGCSGRTLQGPRPVARSVADGAAAACLTPASSSSATATTSIGCGRRRRRPDIGASIHRRVRLGCGSGRDVRRGRGVRDAQPR